MSLHTLPWTASGLLILLKFAQVTPISWLACLAPIGIYFGLIFVLMIVHGFWVR